MTAVAIPRGLLGGMPPVVVDTREQTPFSAMWPAEVLTVRRGLDAGDYSLEGYSRPGPTGIALERKSLPDLVACLTTERRRFMACLERLRGYQHHAIVVEAEWGDLTRGTYRSTVEPSALVGSIASIMSTGVPVLFAGNAFDAADVALRFLAKAWKRATAAEQERAGDPLAGWDHFAAQVRERLEAGRASYGDRSFDAPASRTLEEVTAELADVCGWSYVLVERLRRLSTTLARLEERGAA